MRREPSAIRRWRIERESSGAADASDFFFLVPKVSLGTHLLEAPLRRNNGR
jgi:hypothetical protein